MGKLHTELEPLGFPLEPKDGRGVGLRDQAIHDLLVFGLIALVEEGRR